MCAYLEFLIDCLEVRIGFTKGDYGGVEGDFVRPVVAILSGILAPEKSVSVRFNTAFLRARGKYCIACVNN